MKNITVSLDDDVYRKARIVAAQRDTSVSRLVRDYLVELSGEESEFDKLKRLESETREQIRNFRGGDRLSREELYDRSR